MDIKVQMRGLLGIHNDNISLWSYTAVSSIVAMAETIAYNVIVYVAKATTQPATEADILKHTCDFIIYKL